MATDDPVDQLLDLLEQRRPLLTSQPELVGRQLVAGGLVAAERLLRAIRVGAQAGLSDATGGLIRSVWECWCVGMYALLKGHDAVMQMAGYGKTQVEKIRRFWPLVDNEADPFSDLPIDPDIEATSSWNLRDIALEVRELLISRGSCGTFSVIDALGAYDVLFRFESHWGSHAGFGLFARYIQTVPEGSAEDPVSFGDVMRFETSVGRALRKRATDGGVAFAAMWVALLAREVYEEFGIGISNLNPIIDALVETAREANPS